MCPLEILGNIYVASVNQFIGFYRRICSRTLMGCPDHPISILSRRSLLPSSYVDSRSPDDVIAF